MSSELANKNYKESEKNNGKTMFSEILIINELKSFTKVFNSKISENDFKISAFIFPKGKKESVKCLNDA